MQIDSNPVASGPLSPTLSLSLFSYPLPLFIPAFFLVSLTLSLSLSLSISLSVFLSVALQRFKACSLSWSQGQMK